MPNIPFFSNSEATKAHRVEQNQNLYFKKYGIEIYPNKGLVPQFEPNRMDFYVLSINRNGSATKDIGLISYQIRPKTIHFLAPGVLHNLSNLSDNIDGYYICFKKEFYQSYFSNTGWLDELEFYGFEGLPLFQLDEATFTPIEKLCVHISNEQEKTSSDRYDFIWAHLHSIHLLANRYYQEKVANQITNDKKVNQNLLVNRFKKLVDQHFKEVRHVSFYAQQLFITPQHLSETVKENTGASPIYWINKRTFLEANYQLRHSDLSVKEIAILLNFSSSAYFTKFYKKLSKGTTPTQFLANLKN